MLLLSLENFAALFADAVLFTVFVFLCADTGGFTALGANADDLAGVHGSFGLNDSCGIAGLFGLNVLGHNVASLDDDLTLLGADLENLTLLAAVLSAEDHNGIACFDMHFTHLPLPP